MRNRDKNLEQILLAIAILVMFAMLVGLSIFVFTNDKTNAQVITKQDTLLDGYIIETKIITKKTLINKNKRKVLNEKDISHIILWLSLLSSKAITIDDFKDLLDMKIELFGTRSLIEYYKRNDNSDLSPYQDFFKRDFNKPYKYNDEFNGWNLIIGDTLKLYLFEREFLR